MGLSEQAVGDDVASRGFAELFGGGRADNLIETLERLDAHLDAGPDPQVATHLLKAVARILVPLNYVAGSWYEHDPALSQPAIPCLAAVQQLAGADDNTRHMLGTALRRSLNRVELELREVESLVTEALQHGLA